MQAWRSMQNAMPGQLNQVAKALLGTNANATTYNFNEEGCIRSTSSTMLSLIWTRRDCLPASFSRQAKDATLARQSRWKMRKPCSAVQTIIEALAWENIAGAINGSRHVPRPDRRRYR